MIIPLNHYYLNFLNYYLFFYFIYLYYIYIFIYIIYLNYYLNFYFNSKLSPRLFLKNRSQKVCRKDIFEKNDMATIYSVAIYFYYFLDSIPSLGAGLLFGSLLGFGAYRISQDPNNFAPLLGTSAALGGLMGYRYYNTGKIMPAGIIALLRFVI